MRLRNNDESAFSLIEVALALGVVAFSLFAVIGIMPIGFKTHQASVNETKANAIASLIIGDLRADVRLPPGQQNRSQERTAGLGLNGHWAAAATPDTLYFTSDGLQTPAHSVNVNPPPANAVFRATVTYLFPPTASTSIAKVTVSWPARQADLTIAAGSIEMFAAVNR